MVQQRRLDATGDRETVLLGWVGGGLVVFLVGGGWVCLHLAALITGTAAPAMNPVKLVADVARGRTSWTPTATLVGAGLVVVLLAGIVAWALLWPKSTRLRCDASNRYLAKPRDLHHLTKTGAEAKAKRIGISAIGLPLGNTLSGTALFSSGEDMLILLAGPRTQKTTRYAIPMIAAAPGPVIGTSNKRDLIDTTGRLRAGCGTVWCFDPQHIADNPDTPANPSGPGGPSWHWDPLSYIAQRTEDGRLDVSEIRAERLAAQFATSNRQAGAKIDPYFDSEAENLLGLLLLAAAVGAHPITQVYRWLTQPDQQDAIDLLTAHNFGLQADSLEALSQLYPKQRDGVFGTARSYTGFLRSRESVAWITNQTCTPAFDPRVFARSKADTLYLLSHDGDGSDAPLVASLTMAVLEALEDHATRQPGGRLTTPVVGVLDEAANICRLRHLDRKYSHYGSRGILLMTILQSWHQGVDAWGENGMEALWSAANIKIYGGGDDEDRYLRRLSDLIGTSELLDRSSSRGRGHHTITRSVRKESILTTAELRALPTGRAVMFASGTPAALICPAAWYEGPYAKTIAASTTSPQPPTVEAPAQQVTSL